MEAPDPYDGEARWRLSSPLIGNTGLPAPASYGNQDDAYLIAAASDFLAALRFLVDRCVRNPKFVGPASPARAAVGVSRAAAIGKRRSTLQKAGRRQCPATLQRPQFSSIDRVDRTTSVKRSISRTRAAGACRLCETARKVTPKASARFVPDPARRRASDREADFMLICTTCFSADGKSCHAYWHCKSGHFIPAKRGDIGRWRSQHLPDDRRSLVDPKS
jgi:hypothetical protein